MLSAEESEELALQLQSLIASSAAIIVEGKKDQAALERLGIDSSRIVTLSKKPLFEIAEEVAAGYKTAAILTDLDSEGKKLYGKLNTLLQRLGVKVDNRLRNFLFKNTKLRQIEGIDNFVIQPE